VRKRLTVQRKLWGNGGSNTLPRMRQAPSTVARRTRIAQPPGGDIDAVLAAYRACAKSALLALDALDARLEREDRYIFVGYDELDTLTRSPDLVRTAVRGVVALWSANTRRWRRLRGKIFLRSDLYEQSATAGGATAPGI
jgi:hypothetical protein